MSNTSLPQWFMNDEIDLSSFPIDSVLRQALSPNDEKFRTGCALLMSMSGAGRIEAGVFLLGLVKHYSENYGRLTLIADSLGSYPTRETVDVFGSELRRVPGSSATRGYLRKIVDVLEHFPSDITNEQICGLASDSRVGARFRQRLKSLIQDRAYYQNTDA